MSGVRKSFVYFEEKLHTLIEKTDEPFLTMEPGFESKSGCSLCCPGYFSYYKIEQSKIYLRDFVICSRNYSVCDENGINIEAEDIKNHPQEKIYKNINRFINFSGNLLIGSNVEPYFRFSRLGVASYWRFKDLKELSICNGTVISIVDRSNIAKEILEVAKTLPFDDFWEEEGQGIAAASLREDDLWWMRRYQNKS